MKPNRSTSAVGAFEHRLALIFGGVAAIAATVAIGLWIVEAPDRKQERLVRKNSLSQSARELLFQPGANIEPNFNTQWAINTLRDLDQPILIKADSVNLTALILPCGEYLIDAKQVWFDFTAIDRAKVVVWADQIHFGAVVNSSELILRNRKPVAEIEAIPVEFAAFRALDTNISVDGAASVVISTFQNVRFLTWLAQLNFDAVQVRNFFIVPPVEPESWVSEDWPSFFDEGDIVLARESFDPLDGVGVELSQQIRYQIDQRFSSIVRTKADVGLSEEWLEYCDEGDDWICNRDQPGTFAEQWLEPGKIFCPKSHAFYSFDPKVDGDLGWFAQPY